MVSMMHYLLSTNIDKSVKRVTNRIIDRLVMMNMEFIPDSPIMGFMYKGQVYVHSEADRVGVMKALTGKGWPSPHMSIAEEVDIGLKTVNELIHEAKTVKQILVLMIKNCTTAQEIRDKLPDSMLHFSTPEVSRLKRIRPLESVVSENALRAYKAAEKSFDYISMIDLLYG